jgi:hypothetical protein
LRLERCDFPKWSFFATPVKRKSASGLQISSLVALNDLVSPNLVLSNPPSGRLSSSGCCGILSKSGNYINDGLSKEEPKHELNRKLRGRAAHFRSTIYLQLTLALHHSPAFTGDEVVAKLERLVTDSSIP